MLVAASITYPLIWHTNISLLILQMKTQQIDSH